MNAIVPIATNADAYRASTDAAGLCREIVMKTAKPIQGRKFVSVEGWQAIAITHGCTASADDVQRVTDEGLSGFKCVGIVRRMSDGQEIARAEGFLGDDERTWSSRPVYARRAMVQTRAISRACRSAFAHVVVMIDAGLSTTPAEEVPEGGFDNGDILEGTPQPTKSAMQARKDGDFERLTGALSECCSEAELAAWAKREADAIGALPHGWKKNLREEYQLILTALRSQAADPFHIALPLPDDTNAASCEEWFDQLLALVGGATSKEELEWAISVNTGSAAMDVIEPFIPNADERLAIIIEGRLAELAAREAV